MPVAEEDAARNVLGGEGTSTGTRNCRGEKSNPFLLDLLLLKASAPRIRLFPENLPWKTPQESTQPLWLETPEK